MVFQHFNLFPHMTVLENVMEGQVIVLGRSKAEAKDKAMAQLTRVGLAERSWNIPHVFLAARSNVSPSRVLWQWILK